MSRSILADTEGITALLCSVNRGFIMPSCYNRVISLMAASWSQWPCIVWLSVSACHLPLLASLALCSCLTASQYRGSRGRPWGTAICVVPGLQASVPVPVSTFSYYSNATRMLLYVFTYISTALTAFQKSMIFFYLSHGRLLYDCLLNTSTALDKNSCRLSSRLVVFYLNYFAELLHLMFCPLLNTKPVLWLKTVSMASFLSKLQNYY